MGNLLFSEQARRWAILVALAIAFAAGTSWLYWSAVRQAESHNGRLILNSPDESAAFRAIRQLVTAGELSEPVPLDGIGGDWLHPRSTVLRQGQVLPASFLGLPVLYGLAAKAVGHPWAALFLTPLLTALAGLLWCSLVKTVWGERVGLWSTALFYALPPLLYFSSRGLFPNALLVDLLIVTAWCWRSAVLAIGRFRQERWSLAAGISLALAVAVRPSEVIWIGAVAIIALVATRRSWRWGTLLLAAAAVVIALAPFLELQRQLFGGPLRFGYVIPPAVEAGVGQTAPPSLSQVLLPFGFHPRLILQAARDYLFSFYWLWAVAGLAGLALVWRSWRSLQASGRWWLLATGLVTVWLLAYYGSWQFYDNPAQVPSIGTSYYRYWLPLFILWLPLVAHLFTAHRPGPRLARFAPALLLLALLGQGSAVWWQPDEGLVSVGQAIAQYQQKADAVAALTEGDAVIVAGSLDKAFQWDRAVAYSLRTKQDFQAARRVLDSGYPVYLYSFTFGQENLPEVQQRFNRNGLALREVRRELFPRESLYQVEVNPEMVQSP